ncbi:MAG: NAD(P)/FAD-dependent oxidoreductase [Candidatus Nezhaarchaeales archaeon]
MVKVAIVGGGLAGVSSLLHLSSSNEIEIDLYDAKEGIGSLYKSTGGISEAFSTPWLRYIKPATDTFIDKVQIELAGRRIVFEAKEGHLGRVIDHTKLEKIMLDKALENSDNIRVHLKSYIREPLKLLEDHDFLIGADGVFSKVAEATVGRIPLHNVYKCLEYWIEHHATNDLYIFFKDYCPGGYIWVFPSSFGVKVGAGIPATHQVELREIVERFLSEHSEFDGRILHKMAGCLPTAEPLEEVVYSGRIALIGDAGRMVNPATGAGIHLALESGKAVAESIVGTNSLERFREYYRRRILPYLKIWHKVKRILFKLSCEELGVVAETIRSLAFPSPTNPNIGISRLLWLLVRHPLLAWKIKSA